VFDAETGGFQNWNRDYNPRTGRYAQVDPIGLRGGINPYAYVGSNPLLYKDPSGKNLLMVGVAAIFAGIAIYDTYEFLRNALEALDSAKKAQEANQHLQDQITSMMNGKPVDSGAQCKAQEANQKLISDALNIGAHSPPGTSANPSLGLKDDVSDVAKFFRSFF
jgi:RHS repeat-associated protein